MKNWRLIIVGAALAVAITVMLVAGGLSSDGSKCGPYRTDKVVAIGSAKFKTEVVRTAPEREKGLSGRLCIESDRAMLFVFERPSTYAIWMKDMKFPIDVLWLSADHKVVAAEFNLDPSTYPDRFINKDNPAQYVLEMAASRAKELNVKLGTLVSL